MMTVPRLCPIRDTALSVEKSDFSKNRARAMPANLVYSSAHKNCFLPVFQKVMYLRFILDFFLS